MHNKCEICGDSRHQIAYEGPIRDGHFDNLTKPIATVRQCLGCGAQRLDPNYCKDEKVYNTSAYRKLLKENESAKGFFEQHDILQLDRLRFSLPRKLRYKTLVDVGCGAGSFLDHVSGLIKRGIAVEPCEDYHQSLKDRGYEVYDYVNTARKELKNQADIGVCFSVLEHIANPRVFLTEIMELLKPGAELILSTPNRDDFLMSLLEDDYRSFFYRTVHTWYFDSDSLKKCAQLAGYEILLEKSVHRFGISNAFWWSKHKKPGGQVAFDGLDSEILNNFWKNYLEEIGKGDYLYVVLKKSRRR